MNAVLRETIKKLTNSKWQQKCKGYSVHITHIHTYLYT